jgi:hypothetical protein
MAGPGTVAPPQSRPGDSGESRPRGGDKPLESAPNPEASTRLLPDAGTVGGWEQGIEPLSAFVSDLLAVPHMARLRRQLANAQADERHAFLFLGWEHMESVLLHPREAREVPAAAPILPEPIDGLWLASLSETTRVLAWDPRRGWFEGRRRVEDLEY